MRFIIISTDYSQNPKQKLSFIYIFVFEFVSSWRHGLQMVNEANEVLLDKWLP